jgi:hypothetical protein
MKPKRLLNTSEYLTESQIRPLLQGTGFRLFVQLRLRDIVELEESDELTSADRQSFNNQTVDFAVIGPDGLAKLVIEFDGPEHARKKQKFSDIRKNRICYYSSIPLLRIDDSYIKKYEKVSALEYLVYRFLAWQEQWEGLVKEFHETVGSMSDEELEGMRELGYVDPAIDPSVIFDVTTPVPRLLELSNELYDVYGVITDYLSAENVKGDQSSKPFLRFSRGGTTYGPFEEKTTVQVEYHLFGGALIGGKLVELEKDFSVELAFNETLPLVFDFDNSKETGYQYFKRSGRYPFAVSNIPWISGSELGENLAEYIAHLRLLEWAKANLSPTGKI